ncbi:DoxX family membrane protein [Pontibacter pudoricolor]|uniref:DoxX family membrane protein n=1 Tax=Pontibacter pudoricolor TaxID=2694930 RepID=UPI0013912D5D|nr:DoxX family membrane protein [Pontibacter pudoricolor]
MEYTPLQKISFLGLRILGSLIFITAGLNNLFKTAGATAKLQKSAFGHLATAIAPAESLVILSGIGLLVGGVMLLAGFKTKLASLGLLAILVPITLTVQIANPEGAGPLFKNVALMGILLFFMVNGAVYYGLDQVLELKRKAGFQTIGNRSYVAVLAFGVLAILGSCTSTSSMAQNSQQTTAKQKYAVLISQPSHLKAAVHTAGSITKDSKYNSEAFVIMACGKSVEAFQKGSEMAQYIAQGRALGVTYKICGMSLKQFNIDQSTLVDGLEVEPNGLTYMFDLQLQGYKTVEL